MKTLFITGTDTGVGKTFVTCALARRARALGLRVFAFKPVETGCLHVGETLVGADQEALAVAAGDWQQGPLRGVYRFSLPAAPLVAALAEAATIDLDQIATTLRLGSAEADLVLVEGAGGWRVPLTETVDMGGLAARTTTRTVIVARAGLGTINHSLLTIEAVERDGLRVEALVLSRQPTDDLAAAESNADQIRRVWGGSVLILDRTATVLDELLPVRQSGPIVSA